MASRHVFRSIPGHLAVLTATLVATAASVTSVYSYFYEGWGQGVATALAYLTPMVLVVGVCAAAVRWPRAGGLLLLALSTGAAAWWLSRRAASGGLTANVEQTAVVMFAPILLTGGLFLFEARHRRLLAAEGARPAAGWWARHYRLVLVVGVPVLAVAIGPARQLPGLLARHDDGERGVRTTTGNGVTLVWAPQGPGWNLRQSDGTYPSWDMLATYGVPPVGLKPHGDRGSIGASADDMARTGLCGYLSEDGSALLADPIRVWRLPTADEVVRSLTRRGQNAGCTWDGRSHHAVCAQPPDKETPLWAPDQPPIYLLTSDTLDANQALGVNYTGGITPHRKSAAGTGVGYRCVKTVKQP